MSSATAPAAAEGLPISATTNSTPASLAHLGRTHVATLTAWKEARATFLTLSATAEERAATLGLEMHSAAFEQSPEAQAKNVAWQTFNALAIRLEDLGERIRQVPPANLEELRAWASAIRFDGVLENSRPGADLDFSEQCTADFLDHFDRIAGQPAQQAPEAELLSVADLERLSLIDLNKLGGILRSVAELMNCSEFAGLLEDISGTIVGFASDVRVVAERRKPRDQAEANWRGWTIAAHGAFTSEPLSDIAAKTAQAASIERFAPKTR